MISIDIWMEATHFIALILVFAPYPSILNVMSFSLRQQAVEPPVNAIGAG